MDFPLPRKKRNEIVSSLCEGKSIVWIFPRTINKRNICRLITADCAENGKHAEYINVKKAVLPGNYMADYCDVKYEAGQLIEVFELMNSEKVPPVFVIDGLEDLGKEDLDLWIRFINKWNQDARRYEATTEMYPKALLVPLDNGNLQERLKEDVYLKVIWFWGWFTGSEFKLLTRNHLSEAGASYAVSMWLESVGVELAGTDIELLAYLHSNVDKMVSSRKDIRLLLAEFANIRGWSLDFIKKYQDDFKGITGHRAGIAGAKPTVPPLDIMGAWNEGMIDWSDETGLTVNSAALAVINDKSTINHRIWRGQSQKLLPIIDIIRLEVCDHLKNTYNEWNEYCQNCVRHPNNDYYSNMDISQPVAEFADIIRFLSMTMRCLKNDRLRRHVDNLRKARNTLAHYVPLEFNKFEFLISELRNTIQEVE